MNYRLLELNDVWQNIIEFWSNAENEWAAIHFAIPEEIYQGFLVLTNVVGYIMPLRLYTPIITFVLGYWLLMITAYFTRFCFNSITSIAGTIARFGK